MIRRSPVAEGVIRDTPCANQRVVDRLLCVVSKHGALGEAVELGAFQRVNSPGLNLTRKAGDNGLPCRIRISGRRINVDRVRGEECLAVREGQKTSGVS